MSEFEFIVAELERKKQHIQRAIDELKQAEATESPDEKRRREEAQAEKGRRSRASKAGWQRRKSAQAEPETEPGGAKAA